MSRELKMNKYRIYGFYRTWGTLEVAVPFLIKCQKKEEKKLKLCLVSER